MKVSSILIQGLKIKDKHLNCLQYYRLILANFIKVILPQMPKTKQCKNRAPRKM